jgi:hypothetical protein
MPGCWIKLTAVASCVLIGMGYTADDAMQLTKKSMP